MYIELKCRSCGKDFRVDFTSNEYDVDKCPKCGSYLSFSDVTRIRAITDPFYTNVSRIDSVSVCGIHTEENCAAGTAIIAADLFSSDIEQLNEVYQSSSPEVKGKLAALIYKFYLLVNSDAQDGNIDKLDLTLDSLRALFLEKANENHKEMAHILGLAQEG